MRIIQKNIGLDDNRNGGIGKDNYGIVSPDVIQGKNDPAPGYYVSVTALFDPRKKKTDPRRYVNSEVIPYLVFNKEDRKKVLRPVIMQQLLKDAKW